MAEDGRNDFLEVGDARVLFSLCTLVHTQNQDPTCPGRKGGHKNPGKAKAYRLGLQTVSNISYHRDRWTTGERIIPNWRISLDISPLKDVTAVLKRSVLGVFMTYSSTRASTCVEQGHSKSSGYCLASGTAGSKKKTVRDLLVRFLTVGGI